MEANRVWPSFLTTGFKDPSIIIEFSAIRGESRKTRPKGVKKTRAPTKKIGH